MTKMATLKDVVDYFGKETFNGGLAEFRRQWTELSETDQTQIKTGIGDGTLTY